MRLVRMLVDADERGTVESVLDGYDVDHVWVSETGAGEDRLVVEFPLPTQAVESVLEELRAARDGEEPYTVVTSAETAVTPHAEELEERFVTGTEEDDSIAAEEIRATALELVAVRTEFSVSPPLPGDRSQQVTVVVTRPVDRPSPELSGAIGTAAAAETGREVTVVVEFVDQQTYALGDGSAQRDVPPASPRRPATGTVLSPAAAVGHTETFRVDRTRGRGLVGS